MQLKRSCNSVRIISLDREEMLARLREIAARLRAERPEVAEVRLFGSLARGEQHGTSDIDVVVLLSESKESDWHRRILTYLPYFDLSRDTDVLVYTVAELEERLAAGDRFLRRIYEESISL